MPWPLPGNQLSLALSPCHTRLQVLIDAVVHAVNKDYPGMAGDFIKLGFLAQGALAVGGWAGLGKAGCCWRVLQAVAGSGRVLCHWGICAENLGRARQPVAPRRSRPASPMPLEPLPSLDLSSSAAPSPHPCPLPPAGTNVAPLVPALEKIWADSMGPSLADFNFRCAAHMPALSLAALRRAALPRYLRAVLWTSMHGLRRRQPDPMSRLYCPCTAGR